jgi:hypothetical protein
MILTNLMQKAAAKEAGIKNPSACVFGAKGP